MRWGLFAVFAPVHDGHNLDDEAEDDENGGKVEATAIEHFGVEDIGVVAAASSEEDISQRQEHDARNHDDIVDFVEDESKFAFGVFGVFDFFCHID